MEDLDKILKTVYEFPWKFNEMCIFATMALRWSIYLKKLERDIVCRANHTIIVMVVIYLQKLLKVACFDTNFVLYLLIDINGGIFPTGPFTNNRKIIQYTNVFT